MVPIIATRISFLYGAGYMTVSMSKNGGLTSDEEKVEMLFTMLCDGFDDYLNDGINQGFMIASEILNELYEQHNNYSTRLLVSPSPEDISSRVDSIIIEALKRYVEVQKNKP